jgi:hypothetical protein
MRRDVKFVAKKLGLTAAELDALIDAPPVEHEVYPNGMRLHRSLTGLRNLLRRVVPA